MPERGTVIRVLPGNRAVIMSESCEFKEIKVGEGVRPGDEVVYSRQDLCERRHYLKITAIAASFLLLCLVAWSAFQQAAGARVYARIAFQVNPAFEISVDRGFRVRSISAFDGEGEELFRGISLRGMNLNEAVSEIVYLCLRRGYLDEEAPNYMAVSFYFPRGVDDSRLLKMLDRRLEAELEGEGIEAYIYYLRIDENDWKQAQKLGVSPISYVLHREAKVQKGTDEVHPAVSLKDPRVKEIASRLAIRVGHSSRKQSGSVEALGATESQREELSSPQKKGVSQQLQPSGVSETTGGEIPQAKGNSLKQGGPGRGERSSGDGLGVGADGREQENPLSGKTPDEVESGGSNAPQGSRDAAPSGGAGLKGSGAGREGRSGR